MAFKVTIGGAAAATLVVSLAFFTGTANAASAVQKECSGKYQAAKSGGTLNGLTYNQFYKQCAAEAKSEKAGGAPSATPTTTAPTTPAPTATAPVSIPTASAPAARPAGPVAAGSAVFPTAISAEFSKETAGKARMHTCLAQYNANKTSNGNGGLKWIEKGGGYYSECNKRLKG